MDPTRRRELRVLNIKAWNGDRNVFPTSSSLDSSLKRNTALIKRLRTAVSSATLNTFLQDIKSLSLHKYLSEVVSACYDGLCKLKSPAEVEAGVEIVSAFHQRFGPDEFTKQIGWLLGKGLATPDRNALKSLAQDLREKEEKDRISRQRVLLRVVTELWLVGVLKTLDDTMRPDDGMKGAATKPSDLKAKGNATVKDGTAEPFPLEVLKDILGHDREHVNLPLVVTFVKTFSWDVLGVQPAGVEGRRIVEENVNPKEPATASNPTLTEPDVSLATDLGSPFASSEIRDAFKAVLAKYFEDVKRHLIRDHKSLQDQARKNAEAYVKSGEVFEDRQAAYEKNVKAQERLISNAQVLADAVGCDMPDLKDREEGNQAASGTIGLVKAGEYLRSLGDGAGIWYDEDERRFYENLVDLKGKVPAILLEDGRKRRPDPDESLNKKADQFEPTGPMKAGESMDELSMSIGNRTIGAQVDALLSRLPDLTSKDLVDQSAIDFCFLNSKASRNRLVKALTEVPKGRNDLLACWSRLIATLGQYMPDITKGVVDYLDAEFRSLQRRKDKEFLGQVRLNNIRYLAELTKFSIVPEHVIFHCLKVSLDDFSRMNIEIMCNLLEHCGRYLFLNTSTAPRMASFLETLQRKKSAQHLGQPERMLIENAMYHVNPPVRPAIEQKERTPMELFIRKLVYLDMTRRNYTKILKQIRRLHWEEPDVVRILEKVFSKPGKIKYGNIHMLAILLSALYRYHPSFVVRVVNQVLESISFGLEQNDYKFYQKRIADVRYLGELYNYRMLEHPVIFDTMYRILTFGHGGIPVPGRFNPHDLPNDFFRVRLVVTILETCGMFFNRGAAGKRLDIFLSLFQYYIYTKDTMPTDIEFTVHDIFALTRPQWRLATNLEDAAAALQSTLADQQRAMAGDRTVDMEERSSAYDSDDDNGDGELPDADADASESSSEEEDVENPPEALDSSPESDFQEEAIVVTRQEEEVDPEDAAEFEREFSRMMAESLESRKFERKPQFDVPVPIRVKNRDQILRTDEGPVIEAMPVRSTMAFSLLTKKGKGQQTRTVELPSDSGFAVAMRNQQQAEREEQQRIKNLVLNYEIRESEDQDSLDDKPSAYHATRKQGKEKAGQRIRKLQLSDVEW
ncbi:hypothetical protein jhhlp_003475 [Lomentospora prolificans]|uniref:MIF4G domain-containing protein n=1 Tax=Lomentospora prolificans TaxID=41688 RepID=A0A2N3N8X5_9PEZI|nr:hypothetical protein jhhlp_003475 [Lomentospora prolificans]